jgi:hypothetical protein
MGDGGGSVTSGAATGGGMGLLVGGIVDRSSAATRKAMDNQELWRRLSESGKRKSADLKRRTGRGMPEYEERVRAAKKAREKARAKRRIKPKKVKPYHCRITKPDGSTLLAPKVRTFFAE